MSALRDRHAAALRALRTIWDCPGLLWRPFPAILGNQRSATVTLALAVDPAPIRVDSDGAVRVGDTRVRLASIVFRHQQGATPEEIHESFPSVPLPDVYAVIGYYLRHQPEVDAYLAELDARGERIRDEVEARPETKALRAKLLAHRG